MALTQSRVAHKLGDTVYVERDGLPNGTLPSKKEVLECLFYLLRPDRAGAFQRSKEEAAMLLAHALVDHWEFCTVYTVDYRYVRDGILKLHTNFHNMRRHQVRDQHKLPKFNEDMDVIFDIFCKNAKSRKAKEDANNVPMGPKEFEFLEDMRNERKQYCLDQVDRKWQKTMERKLRREASLEAKKSKSEKSLSGKDYDDAFNEMESVEESESALEGGDDSEFQPDIETEVNDGSGTRKRKYRPVTCKVPIEQTMNDKLPLEYRHLRNGIRSAKAEFYRVVDKLQSTKHCSAEQAIAGVIETANIMFDRNWKYHLDSKVIDLDTAPGKKEIRTAGKSILWLTLSEIVDEMMEGSDAVITYHEDGSKKKGVGSFSVQGVTIDGKYRAFPTLPISSESRENLADLKRTVLDILSCVNGKYTPKEIYEKITFRISDGTSHNFNIDELVAIDLGTDYIPEHLFCHTHPVLMFNRKLVDVFSSIESEIGSNKIYSKFLVEVNNTHETVTEQYIHGIVNLFSPEMNHKAWNQSDDFNLHIAPEKNLAVAFRTERFNRFIYLCAVLLYHDNHVWTYLQKYENVTNTLACVVRAFEDIDFLKIHCAVGALIGIHLVDPYLSLTTSTNVPYSKLTTAMRQLYHDLTTTNPGQLLNISKQAFQFVSDERFQNCFGSWPPELLESVKAFVNIHSDRVICVLKLVLPRCAEGFHLQRGSVFGFGTFDPNSPMLVTNKNMSLLNKAPINNLASERHVGSVNYGLSVHGEHQLDCVSSGIVKAKSYDLVELKPIDEFTKYRCLMKKDSSVQQILKRWSEKQESLMKDGLHSKEVKNAGVEERKMKDLVLLKEYGGPFTKPEEVDQFLSSNIDDSLKDKRMYHEVRYARDTSLTLPKSSPLFRLKDRYQNIFL